MDSFFTIIKKVYPLPVFPAKALVFLFSFVFALAGQQTKAQTVIGGVDMGDLPDYLFFFADGSNDANWQGATKGFAGNVAVDGIQADERTSGGVPYAGTIYTNSSSLGKWEKIVDQNDPGEVNPAQAFGVTNQASLIAGLEADLANAFSQINALPATPGYSSVSSTSLNGLNTQNSIAQTFVINITSGLKVSSKINITGDAGDVFILRWDSDGNPNNGYQGQTKFQSGGAIVPLGGLKPSNFINVAGDINSSGGGSNPPAPYPQGPRLDDGAGALIANASNFSGGGFFTGYWLTTGDPSDGESSSMSNAIFVGGWYTTAKKFSLTSGTSGVYVSPNIAPANSSLGDCVWDDTNQNGIKDNGEKGIPDVTVQLRDCQNQVLKTTTTNEQGIYHFPNLQAGCYRVCVLTLSGYQISPQNVGNDATDSDINPNDGCTADIDLLPGENDLTNDAGFFQPAPPPDCVNDISITTDNGTIIVTGLDGAPVSSLQVFSSTGQLLFNCFANCGDSQTIPVPSGSYFVFARYFTVNNQLICEKQLTVTVTGGDPCTLLGGDNDGDGICNDEDCRPDDPFFPATPGKSCDDNDPTTINDKITTDGCDCKGTFDPCALLGGDTDGDGICDDEDCRPDDAFYPTLPGKPCDDGNPSTENDVVLSDGCSCAGTPIVVCDNVQLGGFIGFSGCQGSFTYCPITSPIPPVIENCGNPEGGSGDLEVVWLKSTTSCLPPTTTFDEIANGNDPHWSVIAGANALTFQPTNVNQNTCFLRCVRRAGCSTFIESNIISLNLNISCITFDRFGVSIGDRIWDDLNGNGIQDTGEPGLSFVYVNLQDGNGNSIRWTNSDANGNYLFFGLTAGTYRLRFSTPTGYEVTLPNATADENKDSNVNPNTGLTPVYNLFEGDHIRNVDAGYRMAGQFLAVNGSDFQFEAVKQDEHTELYWAHNASEEVVEYVIERSTNGAAFEEITLQNSKGGNTMELYFDFDLSPATGDNLYRVKLVRADGTTAYSDPVNVHFTDLVDFSVFPNPASDFVKINLETLVRQRASIQIIGNMGNVIRRIEVDEVYSKYYQIDLRDLKEGLYSIWVQSPNQKAKTAKLVVAKP